MRCILQLCAVTPTVHLKNRQSSGTGASSQKSGATPRSVSGHCMSCKLQGAGAREQVPKFSDAPTSALFYY